jgi:hypothetical protein
LEETKMKIELMIGPGGKVMLPQQALSALGAAEGGALLCEIKAGAATLRIGGETPL